MPVIFCRTTLPLVSATGTEWARDDFTLSVYFEKTFRCTMQKTFMTPGSTFYELGSGMFSKGLIFRDSTQEHPNKYKNGNQQHPSKCKKGVTTWRTFKHLFLHFSPLGLPIKSCAFVCWGGGGRELEDTIIQCSTEGQRE